MAGRAGTYRGGRSVSVLDGGWAMEDILSQGGDREPSRWPRRLGVIGAAVLVLVLGFVYLSRAGHSRSPAAAASTPASASTAEPTGIAGPDLLWAGSVQLPVAGSEPAWFSPATGVSTRIGGLPTDNAGYQFIRADGGWVVRAGSGGELASGDASVPPLPVWFLADGARSATRIGTANQVTPAATAGAVWLTSYPPSADPATAARTAREVSVTGVPLGRPVPLLTGYAIYQATDRGLLLTPVSQRTGPQADKLWNPDDRRSAKASTLSSRRARPRSRGRRRARRRVTSRCSTWRPAGRPRSSCPRGVSRRAPRSARAGVCSGSR